jgi:hypothetical protein
VAGKIAESRIQAIQGALKTLGILGIDDAINGFPRLAARLQRKTVTGAGWH